MIDPWIIVLGAGAGCLVVAAVAWLHGRRREPGTPDPEILDDTEPLDPDDKVPPCVHGVPVSQRCERCDGAWSGKHVTIDDDSRGST